jgi:hypothetical protein
MLISGFRGGTSCPRTLAPAMLQDGSRMAYLLASDSRAIRRRRTSS